MEFIEKTRKEQVEELANDLRDTEVEFCETWHCHGCKYEQYGMENTDNCTEIKQAEKLVDMGYCRIIETKKIAFISDRADTPFTDYRCDNCGNDDSVCEEDNYCSRCGAKFVETVNEER